METTERIQITVTQEIGASPERVFDAWLDVEKARRFMFATETGEIVRAEVDARVGGGFTFVDRREGVDAVHSGEYLELERPRRIVFTFSVDGSDATTVSVEIEASGAGSTVTLSHEMAAEWAEYKDRTIAGWAGILAGLAAAV